MDLKLGKKPFTEDHRDFKLFELLEVSMPPLPPRHFGHGTIFQDGEGTHCWGMLGNNKAGDCVEAGAAHETKLYTRLGHHVVDFTEAGVLGDYGAATGYDPSTGNNDDGTEVRSYMGYRRSTGVVDAVGQRHKIDAYLSLDPGDWDMMLRCVWTFGAAGIGFEVQDDIFDKFDAGEPLVYDKSASIIGGHYVPIVASRKPDEEVTAISWAGRMRISKDFYEERNDETWIPLSQEQMLRGGYNVRHIDWDTLQQMLNSLGG